MNRNLVIFGAWYFADVVEELASELGWTVLGRIDPDPPQHVTTLGAIPEPYHCAVAIGDNSQRRFVTERLSGLGHRLASLVHPSAVVSASAKLGPGIYIGENAVIRTGSRIGDGVAIHAGSVVSHHCVAGNFSSVGSGATLGSRVVTGAEVLIGAGATIRPSTHIGTRSVVGAGAVVIRTVADDTVMVGVPAKPTKQPGDQAAEKQSDWTQFGFSRYTYD